MDPGVLPLLQRVQSHLVSVAGTGNVHAAKVLPGYSRQVTLPPSLTRTLTGTLTLTGT